MDNFKYYLEKKDFEHALDWLESDWMLAYNGKLSAYEVIDECNTFYDILEPLIDETFGTDKYPQICDEVCAIDELYGKLHRLILKKEKEMV